jgi:hypothetical protein
MSTPAAMDEEARTIPNRRPSSPLAGSAWDDRRLANHFAGYLGRRTRLIECGRAANVSMQNCKIPPIKATRDADLRAFRGTGATGLEPATSGVTGRVGHNDDRRRTPLNVLICRRFSSRGWLRSAWLSQSSERRLGHEWATESCLRRQHVYSALKCRRANRRARTTRAPAVPRPKERLRTRRRRAPRRLAARSRSCARETC